MEHLVFYFSGTGNCLKIAKDIAKALGTEKPFPMARSEAYTAAKRCDTVGFVYPTYFAGIPKSVERFIRGLDLPDRENTYFYAISTYGGFVGNGVSQLCELLLDRHNIKLNYGQKLKMFSNYVVLYDMSKNVEAITKKSDERFLPILNAIKNRENNTVKHSNALLALYYRQRMKRISSMDKHYTVDDRCTACGVCEAVCPVKNIELADAKPRFKNNCEQCVACIQYCPQRAINYKHLTQKRGRYTNPEIDYRELHRHNNA